MIHSKGGHWKELSVYQQVSGTVEQTPALWMTSCIFAFYSVNQTTLWSIAPSGKNALVIKWSETLHFGNQNPSLSSTPCRYASLPFRKVFAECSAFQKLDKLSRSWNPLNHSRHFDSSGGPGDQHGSHLSSAFVLLERSKAERRNGKF